MTARRTGAARRGRVRAVATVAFAAGAAATGLVLASPGQAASGIFLYKDGGTGVLTSMFFPPDEKCFDVFKGSEAKNFTGSNAILFRDGLCSEVLITMVPGESLDLEFNSVGFTPPGGTEAQPPAVFEPAGWPVH